MAGSEDEQDPQKPSAQRGGTTPDDAEAREKGEWSETAVEGIVPAEEGGSDAREEMLPDQDPEYDSSVLGRTTGSDEPASEEGIDPSGGDRADATEQGGPKLPEKGEPDMKDMGAASQTDDS